MNKWYSIDTGNDPFEVVYSNKIALHKISDTQLEVNIEQDYKSWFEARDYTAMRLCFYDRDEEGNMTIYRVFKMDKCKPKPRYLNRPVEKV